MQAVALNDLEDKYVAQADEHLDQCDLLGLIRHQTQQLVILDLQGLIHPVNLRHAQAVRPIPIRVQAHQSEHHEILGFTAAKEQLLDTRFAEMGSESELNSETIRTPNREMAAAVLAKLKLDIHALEGRRQVKMHEHQYAKTDFELGMNNEMMEI